MKTKHLPYLLLCICLLFASCKKQTALDPLSNVVFSKNGVIRIECADCKLEYTVLDNNFAIDVKNSKDVQFSYVSDFELKTNINSNANQNIRLAVFDSYGRIISNELASFKPGEFKTDTFKIKIK